MKKLSAIALVVSILFIGLLSFMKVDGAKIKGNIIPVDGAVQVWAINNTDTLRANIVSGSFEFAFVKPGVYNIMVETKPEYSPFVKPGVNVAEGQITELGNIHLEKKPVK